MIKYITKIVCDNCEAQIKEPKDVHKLVYSGVRDGSSAMVRADICPRCAEEFQQRYVALFVKG